MFPIIVTGIVGIVLPSALPLLGMLMLGNLFKESGVVPRLVKTASNELINIVTILLGVVVGTKAFAPYFLTLKTLKYCSSECSRSRWARQAAYCSENLCASFQRAKSIRLSARRAYRQFLWRRASFRTSDVSTTPKTICLCTLWDLTSPALSAAQSQQASCLQYCKWRLLWLKLQKPVKITETILRDAHQSQAATRMRLEEMLPACALLDKAGYYSLECWGGATFDSCLRF